MEQEKKEFGKWWIFILALIVLTIGVLTMTGYIGKVANTAIDRKVMEQSYQKQAGDNARNKTYRAQLAHINSKLNSGTLDAGTKAELEAQKAMLEVQLAP
jgi:cell division protein FtsB